MFIFLSSNADFLVEQIVVRSFKTREFDFKENFSFAQMLPSVHYTFYLLSTDNLLLHMTLDKDEIVGFVKCRNYHKTNALADHAMVFMVRGLHRKWKQPVSYQFTQHGMKVANIVHNIKQIITILQKIGLNVVATISDQQQ